jgi:hypothetical protein
MFYGIFKYQTFTVSRSKQQTFHNHAKQLVTEKYVARGTWGAKPTNSLQGQHFLRGKPGSSNLRSQSGH